MLATEASAAEPACAETQVVTPTDGTGILSETGHGQCGGPGSSAVRNTEAPPSVCAYELISAVPAWAGELDGALPGGALPQLDTHVWYQQSCPGGYLSLIAVPTGSRPANGPVGSPEDLAIWARNHMQLPRPAVSFNPRVPSSVGSATVVGLPTWWWVTNWSERTQFTEAGPVWVNVTASPVRLLLQPGDGQRATCDGPGLPWSAHVSETDPRACTYRYEHSSAGEPGRRYTATLTTVWRVTWTGSGGAGGTLPDLTLSSPVPVPVLEVQTVITGAE
jgi:hypothetical protein